MFKKNMKGAVFALIAAATLTGTAAPVFAADPTSFNNSTASTVSGTHNETFTAGSDASQNQVGKETDQVLGGATAGSGNYVYAKGDITYPELHAGSYSGVFNLAVNLNYSAK